MRVLHVMHGNFEFKAFPCHSENVNAFKEFIFNTCHSYISLIHMNRYNQPLCRSGFYATLPRYINIVQDATDESGRDTADISHKYYTEEGVTCR